MFAKHVYFRGHVQGVGFRYTTKQIAAGFEVVGWVRNLSDGRVEMECSSHDIDELEAFLKEIETGLLSGNIQEIESKDIPSPKDLKGFSIR